jgi:hypothetical protein
MAGRCLQEGGMTRRGIRCMILWLSLCLPLLAAAAPLFLPTAGGEAASLPHWQPESDSLSGRRIDLGGTWSWSGPPGAGQCTVPGCWRGFDGELRFARDFELPADGQRHQYRLWFGGVSHACRVLVNGRFLDSHAGAGGSFTLDVPERILQFGGGNRIEVLVDNRLSAKQTVPLKHQSWDPLTWGGIFREVALLETPRLRVEDVVWQLEPGSRGREVLALTALVRNLELVRIDRDSLEAPEQLWLHATLAAEDGRLLGQARVDFNLRKLEQAEPRLELHVDPLERWSPEQPILHRLELVLGQDQQALHRFTRPVGLREVQVRGGRLLLNGQELRLQGLSYVPEHPAFGIALRPEIMARDLELIKNLGVNLLLHLGGAPHPLLADLCDRIGLLLLPELPVWSVPPRLLAGEALQVAARDQLREALLRDRQRASLLGISLGSGLDLADPRTLAWCEALGQVRDLAPQALLAVGGFFSGPSAGVKLPGIELLLLEPRGSVAAEPLPDLGLPIVFSRLGVPVEPGNQEGYENPYSELHQARQLQLQLAQARQRADEARPGSPESAIAGTLVHAFADWRGGRPLLWSPPGQDPALCPRGVFNRERLARSAAKELGSLYAGTAGATLTRGEYTPRHPVAYPIVGFGLLILLLIGYRQNNVFSQNLRRSFNHSHGFFVDVRDNRIYQFGQTLFLWVLVSGGLALLLSTLLFRLRKSLLFDQLLGQLLVIDAAKEWAIRLAWNPIESMAQITMGIMGLVLLKAFGLRVLGLLFNARFTLRQAMTFICWSSASLLALLPVGIVFSRLLQIDAALWPTALVIALFVLWSFQRLFKSLRIAFEGSFWAVALLLVVLGLALSALLAIWYENSHSFFEYLEYYRRIHQGGA